MPDTAEVLAAAGAVTAAIALGLAGLLYAIGRIVTRADQAGVSLDDDLDG